MKLDIRWIMVPIALGIIFGNSSEVRSETLTIAPNFQPDPITIKGNSGGTVSSDCGFIGKVPNQVLEVTQNISSLRFTVQSSGAPTLLIVGPKGRFCVPGDSFSGGKIDFPGYGDKGTYSIYVGDRTQSQHPFTLSISQKPN